MKLIENTGGGPLLLLDGHSLAYRAYYAVPGLENTKGIKTGAVSGFLNILLKLIKEIKPEYLAIAFDKEPPYKRKEIYPEYKATRQKMPEDLHSQLESLYELTDILKIPVLFLKGWEADDCLASTAKDAAKQGVNVVIVSSDRDLIQTVSERVSLLCPKKGISSFVIYDEKTTLEEYGFSPKRIIDYKALAGDSSDNIPGGKGIGDVTAKKLIAEFGDIDSILSNIPAMQPKHQKLVSASVDSIKLSYKLAKIEQELPVAFDRDKMKIAEIDDRQLLDFLNKMEFYSVITKLFQQQKTSRQLDLFAAEEKPEQTADIKKPAAAKSQLGASASKDDIYVIFENDAVICDDGSVFTDPAAFSDFLGARRACSYDMKPLLRFFIDRGTEFKQKFFDIALAYYIIYPQDNAHDFVRAYSKAAGEEYDKTENISNAEKFAMMEKMQAALEKKIAEYSMTDVLFNQEQPLLGVLALMEHYGIYCDSENIAALSELLGKQISSLKDDIETLAGEKFNINSPKQLAEILYDKLQLPCDKKRSTDVNTLNGLINISPCIPLILKYRELQKLHSSYTQKLPALIAEDGKIHTHYDSMKTATGRVASNEPNLQNIPIKTALGREIRKAFRCQSEDFVFISADYSQIELRIMAHFADDDKMAEAFRNNIDIHTLTASEIFDLSTSEVTGEMRKKAKGVNFGIIYGISAHGLSQNTGITRKEAQEYIDRYFERFPKIKEFIKRTTAEAEANGYVSTIFGRRRYVDNITSRNKTLKTAAERIAVNTVIQGSAADIIKSAMIKVDRKIKDMALESKMLLQIHDELLFETKITEIDTVKRIIIDCMEKNISLKIPLTVNIEKGKNWSEMELIAK